MRIVTWNIQHGGRQQDSMAQALEELGADIAVLTEFRVSTRGTRLLEAMALRGFKNFEYDRQSNGSNAVIVASRLPLRRGTLTGPKPVPHRWQHFRLEGCAIDFLGIYLHGGRKGTETLAEKQQFWDRILEAAEELAKQPALILGDLNTGKHFIDEDEATFRCTASFEKLSEIGWIDLPRHFHHQKAMRTWWSNRRGFRLDHAFATASLAPRVTSADYVYETESHVLVHPRPRPWPPELGKSLSDHAALVIDFD